MNVILAHFDNSLTVYKRLYAEYILGSVVFT